MRKETFRILHPYYVPSKLVDAAENGLKSLRRFKAIADSVCSDGKSAFRGVRYSAPLRSAASAVDSIRLDRLPSGIFDDFGSVLGIALTTHRLLRPHGEDMLVFSSATAYKRYALVSYYKLSDESPEVFAKMVQRQAGFLLIPTRCTAECLLQGVSDFNDFVEKCVTPDRDFCGDCSSKLGTEMNRLRRYP